MKRRAFTVIEALIVLSVAGVLAALVWPIFRDRPRQRYETNCPSNLKQIFTALRLYEDDHASLPPVALNAVSSSVAPFNQPYGWADAAGYYLRSLNLLHCDANSHSFLQENDATKTGFTDYWLNSNVAGRASKYFDKSGRTILCGDGNDGTDQTNGRYSRNALSKRWLDFDSSPARRHLDRGIYIFVDGHVEVLSPVNVVTGSVWWHQYTFSIH